MRRDSRSIRHSGVSPWGNGAGMSQEVFDTRVLPLFGLGLLLAGGSAFIGFGLPPIICLLAVVVEIALVWTSGSWAQNENRGLNVLLYGVVTICAGLAAVPLLRWANMINPMLIMQAFAVTGITFGGLMAYSMTTKRSFEGMGGFLMAAIIGVIVASIVNIFIGSTMLSMIVSMVAVLVFAGFVLYDMSVIRDRFDDSMYIMAAIMLFIDFMGLFQNILYLMGIMGSDD